MRPALAAFAAAWLAALIPGADPPPKPVDFDRDVRPVFAKHCAACHGPAKQRGGFRLDRRADALKGGDSGAAIVPSKAAASPLLRFVSGTDPDTRMPPEGAPLAAAEVATLRAWIDQGAKWPDDGSAAANPADWWSLRPVRRPTIPGVRGQESGVSNPVDAFVRAKLAEQGLKPSPEADPRTLVRRVTFDLTGLPPTPEEIDAFLADTSPDAYGKLVDRLLASPAYGERWARHWLDVVHFGETHGYDKDKPRPNAWPYRDYVIRSLNADKPYDRFVQEQVAGDVLFPGTADGVEALGFLAAGPWDFIGHAEVPETKTDGKVARHLDRDDMVSNTAGTFLGLTVHCAQCHNHKFDPITQEDYYSLHAVFAALDRADKGYDPDPAVMRRRAELEARRDAAADRLARIDAAVRANAGTALADLDRQIAAASAGGKGSRPEYGYHSALAAKPDVPKWVQVDLGAKAVLARVVVKPCHDDFNKIGAGFGFPVRFKVEVSDDATFATAAVVADRTAADVPNPGTAPQPFPVNEANGRYIRVTATKLAPRQNDYMLALAELEVYDAAGTNLAAGRPVSALDSIEAPVRWRKSNLTDGIAPGGASADELAKLTARRAALVAKATDAATAAERASAERDRQAAEAELKKLPDTRRAVYAGTVHRGGGNFVGTGATGGKPRPIFVLARGDVTKPGKEVGPGAVAAVPGPAGRFALPPGHAEGDRRAALAKWLTDPVNPLTARVIANRVWHYHFGRGIVDTPNDFGKMGQLPTHPELLDWLASELVNPSPTPPRFGEGLTPLSPLGRGVRGEGTAPIVPGGDNMVEGLPLTPNPSPQRGEGDKTAPPSFPGKGAGGLGSWSLKHLHRLMVTSATYKQVSAANPAGDAKDSDNRLLWRQNRRKLEAEAVRDSILAVAGKLDRTTGGPSFQDFVIEKPEHSPHYQYHLHDPDDPRAHRRAVYRFVVRSKQQPFMAALDCADPSLAVDRRNQTLTPQQALALLNNRLAVAMAKHFADRVAKLAPDDAGRMSAAVRLALGRDPTPAERDALAAHAKAHGLANACRVVFNLNEFVFVD